MQDRSDRVRWLLEEMKVPYTDILLNKSAGELNTPEYLKINPMGRVPTIIDGDHTVFESAAICLYLADKYSYGKLAPKIDHHDRAEYLKWMVWSVGSLECVVARMFTHVRNEKEQKATHAFVEEQCAILKRPLEAVLSKQDYILKSGFSAADIMLGAIIPGAFSYLIVGNKTISNYIDRLKDRPAALAAQVF
jgi:glutathione S-transferase